VTDIRQQIRHNFHQVTIFFNPKLWNDFSLEISVFGNVTVLLWRGFSSRFERMCRLQLQGLKVDSSWTWDLESLEATFSFETFGNHPGTHRYLQEFWDPQLDRRETRNFIIRLWLDDRREMWGIKVVLCIVRPCSFVDRYKRFGRTCRWCLSTMLHIVTPHENDRDFSKLTTKNFEFWVVWWRRNVNL
jgi:hypothetical protein